MSVPRRSLTRREWPTGEPVFSLEVQPEHVRDELLFLRLEDPRLRSLLRPRVFRDETTAISDMAKRPFTRIRSRRNRNSMETASKEGVGMNYTRRRTRFLWVRKSIHEAVTGQTE